MGHSALIGLDLGTTNIKAVAFDASGNELATSERSVRLEVAEPGRAEQDPSELMDAAFAALGEVVDECRDRGTTIEAIGTSAAMHSLVALDRQGRALTPVLTWADARAGDEAKRIASDWGDVYLRTGTPVHPMSPLTKLLWFRDQETQLFETAWKWVSVKELFLFQLTGEMVVDHAIAAASGLFNLFESQWDEAILDRLGLSAQSLAAPVPSMHAVHGIRPDAAHRLGLDARTPVVVGGSDGVLANLGTGAIDPGVFACSLGTSGAVRTVVPEIRLDPNASLFCYPLASERWVIGGPINNGGACVDWALRLFPDVSATAARDGVDAHDLFDSIAQTARPTSDGLLFLPYLLGERAPQWNADAKGVFFGLTLAHQRPHLFRSILEGVIYQMRLLLDSTCALAGRPTEIRAAGGFGFSQLWCQIMADVFDQEILVPAIKHGSALGAAVLAGVVCGFVGSLEEIKGMVRIEREHRPDPEAVAAYASAVERFQRLYQTVEAEF